jgi:hypothetical protein
MNNRIWLFDHGFSARKKMKRKKEFDFGNFNSPFSFVHFATEGHAW